MNKSEAIKTIKQYIMPEYIIGDCTETAPNVWQAITSYRGLMVLREFKLIKDKE